METKDYDEAAKSFQLAINDDPSLGAAYVGMSVVLIHQMRFQAALPLLDRAEGLLPGNWFVHFAKAWAELQTGDIEAALRQADFAERLAATDPEEKAGVSYLRAMVSIHTKDIDAAKAYLHETVTRDRASQYAALANKELETLGSLLTAKR